MKVNLFLDKGKFTAELHWRQPRFAYSTCGLFTKHCKRIQKFRGTGNLRRMNSINLVLLMMQHVLKIKIYLREMFQINFESQSL